MHETTGVVVVAGPYAGWRAASLGIATQGLHRSAARSRRRGLRPRLGGAKPIVEMARVFVGQSAPVRRGALLCALAVGIGGCSRERPAPAAAPSASAPTPLPRASPSGRAPSVPFDEQVAQSQPLAPQPVKQAAGSVEITASACTITGGNPVHRSTRDVLRAVRVVGDRLWVAGADEKVHAYRIAPGAECRLALDDRVSPDGTLALDVVAHALSTDASGRLYVSNGVFAGALVGRDGKLEYPCRARPGSIVALHPTGRWGLGHAFVVTVTRVELSAAGCESSPWALRDLATPARKGPLSNVSTIAFVDDQILVGGIVAKEVDPNAPRVVLSLDAKGKERFRFGNPAARYVGEDRLGWVQAIAPCQPGICVVDSKYQRLSLWTREKGEFLGAVRLANLLGLRHPTVNDLTVDPAGAYLIAGQQREGSSVAEGVIYRLSGL
ncbi:MAG: hypothetical protein IT376_09065 [Polyangiaceae bacterium]|nr:hypothetical protein [Polyangiaceae bacterium]